MCPIVKRFCWLCKCFVTLGKICIHWFILAVSIALIIYQALIGLQTMKSFAEYPLHMQEKLVKVAWYEL